jgi:hypothetical protein
MFDPKILPIEFAKWYDEDYCLKAVRQDPYNLKLVKNQTEEICLEAVKGNVFSIQYVKNQTEEMCLIAVKLNGYVLQFIHNQTEKICLIALAEEPDCIRYLNFHQLSQEAIEEILLRYHV